MQLSLKRDQTYVSLMKNTSPCLYFDEVTWNISLPWSWIWSFILHVSIKSQPWNGPTSCTWCFCLKNCFLDMVTSLNGICVLSFLCVHHYGACRKIRKFNRCGIKVIFKKMLKMIRFWLEFEIHPIQRRNFNSISFHMGLPWWFR